MLLVERPPLPRLCPSRSGKGREPPSTPSQSWEASLGSLSNLCTSMGFCLPILRLPSRGPQGPLKFPGPNGIWPEDSGWRSLAYSWTQSPPAQTCGARPRGFPPARAQPPPRPGPPGGRGAHPEPGRARTRNGRSGDRRAQPGVRCAPDNASHTPRRAEPAPAPRQSCSSFSVATAVQCGRFRLVQKSKPCSGRGGRPSSPVAG